MTTTHSLPNMNPDAYASMYARQNGMSIRQAQSELRTQFGDPVQRGQGSIFQTSKSVENSYVNMDFQDYDYANSASLSDLLKDLVKSFFSLINFGNTEGPKNEGDPQFDNVQQMQQQDPDEYAKEYAAQNNLTLEEAKEELREQYGNPTQRMSFNA